MKLDAAVQRKLTVGAPGDKYEQEADRVAEQVVQQINPPAHVQQNGGSINLKLNQESQPNNNPVSISALNSNSLNVQAAYESAIVVDRAHIHKVSTKDTNRVSKSNYIGEKLKKSDEIQVDETDSKENNEWFKAKKNASEGYIRKTKYFKKQAALVGNETNPNAESTTLENVVELGDKTAEGINDTYADYTDNEDAGLAGGVSDGIAGVLGMIDSAKGMMGNQKLWEKLEAGYALGKSSATVAAGVSNTVDTIDSTDSSQLTKELTGAIADGLSGVKDAVLTIVKFYKLYHSTSGNKPKEAAIIFQQLVNAASNGARVAKSAYSIISDNVPMAVIYTVPAFSMAMSAISLILRLLDAVDAGNTKTEMTAKSNSKEQDSLTEQVAKALGYDTFEPNKTSYIGDTRIFEGDRRGTFPNYKTYFRIKSAIKKPVKELAQKSEEEHNKISVSYEKTSCKTAYDEVIGLIDQKISDNQVKTNIKTGIGTDPPLTVEKFNTNVVENLKDLKDHQDFQSVKEELGEIHKKAIEAQGNIPVNMTKPAYDAVIGNINTQLNNEIGKKIKSELTPEPRAADEFKTGVVDKIAGLKTKVEEYEFVDKMSEINQKRQTAGWTDVALELVNIAGDITTIAVGATGVGVLVGQGMKAGAAGYKVAHESAKFAQKLYRDRKPDDKKSTRTKHQEYCDHARFIYNKIAAVEPSNKAKAQECVQYITATGVNLTLFFASGNPAEKLQMLVTAMKKRGS